MSMYDRYYIQICDDRLLLFIGPGEATLRTPSSRRGEVMHQGCPPNILVKPSHILE